MLGLNSQPSKPMLDLDVEMRSDKRCFLDCNGNKSRQTERE